MIGYFADVLRLSGGDFEGKPFILEPFEKFIVGSLFGWKAADGFRRFRVAYVEMGKGSGKSALAAGIGHYGLSADGEKRAEIYAAASKRDQAMVLFRDAVAMRDESPTLCEVIRRTGVPPFAWNLSYKDSFFRVVSSEDSQSGPRPHMALIDEIHEHRDAVVVEMMRKGTKNRRQPLIFEITNSGFDRESICYQHHDYSRRVLSGAVENDRWFAYVCTLDPCAQCRADGAVQPRAECPDCDDWHDEAVWMKANPGLGTVLPVSYLREQVQEAEGMPASEGVVKRLNFCLWTQQVSTWLPLDRWMQCAKPAEVPTSGRCFGGLDLASTTDLCAFVLMFPGSPAGLRTFFFCPEAEVLRRAKERRVPYELWATQGRLLVTPGDVVDYGFVRAKVQELAQQYRIEEIAYDRWNASDLVNDLQNDGFTMVPIGQGFAGLSAPSKELLRIIRGEDFVHDDNPVMNWMVGNVASKEDPAGNVKPDRSSSSDRIDGVVATVMAISRMICDVGEVLPNIREL